METSAKPKEVARTHKDLDVWRKAYDLTLSIYRATTGFPPEEQFGLAQQMRRAAVSIVANIAEGSARRSRAEFRQFVSVARGSYAELEAYLLLAQDLRYLQAEHGATLVSQSGAVGKMLSRLASSLAEERIEKGKESL